MRSAAIIAFIGVLFAQASYAENLAVTLEKNDQGVAVTVAGKPFTQYVVKSRTKPILWPIIGADGLPLTRAWPMAEQPDEKHDHPHHRSLWLTHGNVNGVDFWLEEPDKAGKKPGTIEHVEFPAIQSGTATEPAVLIAKSVWKSPDGKPICDDLRTLRFGADSTARWIDFDIAIKAAYGPVKFGDTKEGSFGVRVAESAKVDAKKGGRIVNSEGLTDDATWGKRAAWVDYHGPVGKDDLRQGIAILNHPRSFRHPTYWHVRTYGLFAANPFGVHEFEKQPQPVGDYVLPEGETLNLRYRVILHAGDEKQGKIAERYAEYEKMK